MSQQIRTATNQLIDPLKVTKTITSIPKTKAERINWKEEYFKLRKEFEEFAMNAINELKAENAQLKEQVKYFKDKYEPEIEI